MTTLEAISGFENRMKNVIMPGERSMYAMALAALREQEERENPKPLTLDELREMDGEPVWLKIAGGAWGLVDMNVSVVWLNRGGDIDLYKIAGLAYRSKPKEG